MTQMTRGTGRAAFAALALVGAGALSGCNERTALSMGLGEKCEQSETADVLGDLNRQYVAIPGSNTCKSGKKGSFSETTLAVIDCPARQRLDIVTRRTSGNPEKRGPNFDAQAQVDELRLKLKVGIIDLSTLEQTLTQSNIPVARSTTNGEECVQMGLG